MGKQKLQINLPHCYLEVARGAMMSFHHDLSMSEFINEHGHSLLVNAILPIISITVIYSYLTIESFVNYQLYQIWSRRNDGSKESKSFLDLLEDPPDFENLKFNKKTRELGDRLKTLCKIYGYKNLPQAEPRLWQDFKELVEISRHFFIHPYPSQEFFQNNVLRIGTHTETGKYVSVAVGIIKYLFEQGEEPIPAWLEHNTLIKFRGVDLLTALNHTKNNV